MPDYLALLDKVLHKGLLDLWALRIKGFSLSLEVIVRRRRIYGYGSASKIVKLRRIEFPDRIRRDSFSGSLCIVIENGVHDKQFRVAQQRATK